MIDSTTVSKDISALVGKLSPALQARALESKIRECRKLITEQKLELAIEHLEGACQE